MRKVSGSRIRVPQVVSALAVAGLGLGLAGCTAPLPSITWYANSTAVEAGPTLYCELAITDRGANCPELDGPTATLALKPGDPVQINIPGELADAPWTLVIAYGDESERTAISNTEKTYSYTVTPPEGKSITQIDLQILTPVATQSGSGVDYVPAQLWVLKVIPVGGQ